MYVEGQEVIGQAAVNIDCSAFAEKKFSSYVKGSVMDLFEFALQMMASTAPVLRNMVTHRFALEGIREAFETASDKKRGAIKVAVTP